MSGSKKNSDKWQMQRERLRLDGSEPLKGVRESDSVSDAVSSLMKRLGLQDQHWLQSLEEDWSSLVGEAVAKHTRPGTLKDRNLTVFVDSSVWISELKRYGKEKVLLNIQKRFGKGRVKTVGFMLDPDA